MYDIIARSNNNTLQENISLEDLKQFFVDNTNLSQEYVNNLIDNKLERFDTQFIFNKYKVIIK